MASYQERADQAIEDQRWHEASQLLTAGIEETPFLQYSLQMQLRRAALPLYREAVRCEAREPSQLSAATATEVHQESSNILQTARQAYREQYGNFSTPHSVSQKEAELIGTLAEISLFNLCTWSLTKQVDDTIVVPATFAQDNAGNGYAHDLGMYRSQPVAWHDNPRTRIQTKYTATPRTVAHYRSAVVVASYRNKTPFGIDRKALMNPTSVSAILASEHATPQKQQDNLLAERYQSLQDLVTYWPAHRAEYLSSGKLTQRIESTALRFFLDKRSQ